MWEPWSNAARKKVAIMKSLLIWIVTALVFTAAGGFFVYAVMENREKGSPEEAKEAPATQESKDSSEEKANQERLSHDEAGNVVILFDQESQARMGIELKPLAAAVHHPETVAYGTLQEDPARTFTVRTPLAGTLRATSSGRWPALGDVLEDGAVIGAVEPRLGPVEQADLAAKLATARADVEQAKATLEAMQTSLESKRRLNAQGKIVSDQALQEAESQVKSEEAKLKGASETVRILQGFMSSATTRPTEAIPLVVRTGGRVLETPLAPGESAESGQAVLKVCRFDRLLARISLPAGESLDARVTQARILIPGHEDLPLTARRVAIAATADTLTGGQTFLFSVEAGDIPLQPGMPIIAHLELPGEPRQGVSVPRSAVVRFGGSTWVYVKTDEEKLTRRPAPVDTATPEGWFVAEGLKPGDAVVVQGAQSVLSEELKFGTKEEEE
jgi:RND family efflux transporter MFP subunit